MKRSIIRDALAKVKRRKGRLMPSDVVSAASEPAHPLHDCFEWDNTKAAHEYRLWQARELIASVQIVYDEGQELVGPVYVSLASDRKGEGGYRSVSDVVSDPTLREEMLETARRELQAFKDRFRMLSELAEVIAAADEFDRRVSKRASKSVADAV